MKITPAMQRCLEYVAGYQGLVSWRKRRRIVREDIWDKCHKAGLLEQVEGPTRDGFPYGSQITDAGRKALKVNHEHP